MIVDHKEKAHELDVFDVPLDIPLDLPPAYDDINAPSTSQSAVASSSTGNRVQARSSFLRRINKPLPATTGNVNTGRNALQSQKLQRPRPSFPNRDKVSPSASAPLSPKAQNDVRETVRGLVRDVVQGSSPVRSSASAALGVLESCAEACSRHAVSFARILQERSIENHAPIYWAIVSRPPGTDGPNKVDNREDDAFLVTLLEHATPLAPVALSELRAACLVASNNTLFQRFRAVPGVLPLSGTDRMLLTSTSVRASGDRDRSDLEKLNRKQKSKELPVFHDDVKVREGGRGLDMDSFSVNLRLNLFQRRMRVSGQLEVEFIARGRLWQLMFFVVPSSTSPSPSPSPVSSKSGAPPAEPSRKRIPAAVLAAAKTQGLPPGSWALALALLEGSTQCYAEARLVVAEPSNDPRQDVERQLPLLGHSRSATTPTPAVRVSNDGPDSHPYPPLPPKHRLTGSETKLSKRSFFRRTTNENKSEGKPRAPIILNLTSTGSSPLIAHPSLSFTSFTLPHELDDLNSSHNSEKSTHRRPTREEKRAARAAAKKEARAREGRETRKDMKERARLAETVLIVGLEEPRVSRKKEELASGGELMYDGCPYIASDGVLRAVLEAHISTQPLQSKDSDCVIC